MLGLRSSKLHGIFPDQGLSPGLLLWQADSLPPGKPSSSCSEIRLPENLKCHRWASVSDFSRMVWVSADRWGGMEKVSREMVVHMVSTGGQDSDKGDRDAAEEV